jgi:hypothetical protein
MITITINNDKIIYSGITEEYFLNFLLFLKKYKNDESIVEYEWNDKQIDFEYKAKYSEFSAEEMYNDWLNVRILCQILIDPYFDEIKNLKDDFTIIDNTNNQTHTEKITLKKSREYVGVDITLKIDEEYDENEEDEYIMDLGINEYECISNLSYDVGNFNFYRSFDEGRYMRFSIFETIYI